MHSRGFSFSGAMTLTVVGDAVTGEFRMRTPSTRVGEVGGSYRDGLLMLTGWQDTEMAQQCRGQVNLRIHGAGDRLSGEIEMTDGCNNKEFRGTIRLRR
jgi:hypothetical protein